MKTSKTDGIVFDIKRFAIHDGGGIRSTLFTKGCPLRCPWCHNPEGISVDIQLLWLSSVCVRCGECLKTCPRKALEMVGQKVMINHDLCNRCGQCVAQCPALALKLDGRHTSPDEIVEELLKDEVFFTTSDGGVTISGGDPLYQNAFNLEVLKRLKEKGIHTTIETSLYGKEADVLELLPYIDKFYVDIKIFDDAKHKKIIGVSNVRILENFKRLVERNVDMIVRIPIIPGYTDDDENLENIADFVFSYDPYMEIELLNYNPLAINKYLTMNQTYTVPKDTRAFDKEEMKRKNTLIMGIRKGKEDVK